MLKIHNFLAERPTF